MFTRILGTGGYLPAAVRTNADLERMVETSDEWIVTRTGIRERRIAASDETAAVMGAKAAAQALQASGLEPKEIDAVICATSCASYAFPSTACEIAELLQIPHPAAMDVSAACAGFNHAYALAHGLIISGQAHKVLVIGTDLLSKACDPHDRGTIIIFGDGAGACVLGASDDPGTRALCMGSDPKMGSLLCLPNLSRQHPEAQYLYMKGNEVFKRAVSVLSSLVTQTLEQGKMQASDLNFLVPHQANLRIIAATARKLHLDMSQVIVNLDKHGNTSAASVPLALNEGIRSGRIKRGDNLLLEAFGGGFVWASALITY